MIWGHETVKENERDDDESQMRNGSWRRREDRDGNVLEIKGRSSGEGLQGKINCAVTGPGSV